MRECGRAAPPSSFVCEAAGGAPPVHYKGPWVHSCRLAPAAQGRGGAAAVLLRRADPRPRHGSIESARSRFLRLFWPRRPAHSGLLPPFSPAHAEPSNPHCLRGGQRNLRECGRAPRFFRVGRLPVLTGLTSGRPARPGAAGIPQVGGPRRLQQQQACSPMRGPPPKNPTSPPMYHHPLHSPQCHTQQQRRGARASQPIPTSVAPSPGVPEARVPSPAPPCRAARRPLRLWDPRSVPTQPCS